LAVRFTVQKSRPSSNFGVIAGLTPGSPHPQNVASHYAKKQQTDVGVSGVTVNKYAVMSSASYTPVGKSAHAVQFVVGFSYMYFLGHIAALARCGL